MTAVTVAAVALGAAVMGAVLALVFDAFGSRVVGVALAALGLLASAGTWAYSVVAGMAPGAAGAASVWGVVRVGGPFSAVGAVISLLAAVAIIGGWNELVDREWGGSLAALVAFGAAASVVVAIANDVTVLLIALETAAGCGYALVSAGRNRGSREAAFKYFVQGAIATAFFVVGMGILVTVFVRGGNIDDLSRALGSGVPVSVAVSAVVLLTSALAFKAGAFPFHSWAPDAYESAAPWSSAFLAAGPKIGAVAALAVLVSLSLGGAMTTPMVGVVTVLAVLSILVGSVTALRQRSYTRMLAYAGIAQVGYALVAVIAAGQPVVALFFICAYAIASTGTFLSAQAFRRVRPNWDGSIDGLTGMAKDAPLLSLCTAVLVISLAGIPPLLGFWTKFVVFATAIVAAANGVTGSQVGIGTMIAVAAAAGLIGSVVSLAYYGGVLRALYAPAAEAREAAEEPIETGGTAAWSVAFVTALVILLGVLPLVGGLGAITAVFK